MCVGVLVTPRRSIRESARICACQKSFKELIGMVMATEEQGGGDADEGKGKW